MQCQNARELFSDYVAGVSDRALSLSLENHLAGCAECREAVGGLKQVWSLLDAMPVEEPPPFFHENLMARIAREEDEAAQKRAAWDWRILFRPRSLAWSAAALVVIIGGTRFAVTEAGMPNPVAALQSLFHSATADDYVSNVAYEWADGTLRVNFVAKKSLSYRLIVDGKSVGKEMTAVSGDTSLEIPQDTRPAAVNLVVLPATGTNEMSVPAKAR